ncbi:acyl-CoA dehydrogenase [Peptoniphilus vaginalis]|uniref:acyl-CoA dehydrogenase n=1 Tax=Peptoniphilus vaginalis TaxID=1756987 RepID=UPI0023F67D4F|nr:acyl-CoA dehydrogenase [Peptoniphilus vaginalis]
MDLKLDKEHLLLQQMYRAFAENEVEPVAADVDATEEVPMENVKKMARYGFFGIPFPKEYGGQGADYLAYAMAVEELSKKCATTGVIVSAHTSLCCAPIYENGTEEQKKKYLPDLLAGKKIGAFGLTEPGAGTDASGQRTTAVLDGDEYVLNGSKIFITNAGFADVFVIIAMTDRSKGNHGISAFIVERGTPGFSVGEPEDKMGIRGSSTCELIFEDCRIPKENLLGREGKGFAIAMKTLDGGRIGIASQALGIAEGAIDETVKYTTERKQFGRRISQFQNTQFELADMKTTAEAAQLLVYRAADAKSSGLPYGHFAAMAKLFAANAASDITRRCLQLFGGYGYTRDYPIERMMRDAKITEIYEGTSEVMKMVVSSWMGVK